jgi:class 3 adenylate cyclase
LFCRVQVRSLPGEDEIVSERFRQAAVGTVSNVASGLCDEAKPGQILISPRVLMKIEDAVKVEPAGEFELKGIRRPLNQTVRQGRIAAAGRYHRRACACAVLATTQMPTVHDQTDIGSEVSPRSP